MRLIGEAGIERDIGDQCAAPQLRATVLDASVDQIRVGRHAVAQLERAYQVRRGQPGGFAHIVEFQRTPSNSAASSVMICENARNA
ncbi:hypothetical protein OKW27_005934 [Paraburkholderia sp. 35.1]